jgi:dTDP-4-amino-4,6-dideoxygalactose transaminase
VSLSDIRDDTFDFDVDRIGDTLDNDTACVVTNNLFGIPSDIEGLRNRIRGKGVFVVEDAAQAMGVRWEGKAIGTRGDAGFFSLGRGKNITCGAGGVIVTGSDEIADAIQRHYSLLETPGFMGTLARYGKAVAFSLFVRSNLFWFPSGIPSLRLGETFFYSDFPCHKLSGMEAGLLKDWKNRLKESNEARLANSHYFIDRLGLKERGDGTIPYLRLPVLMETRETRDRIFAASVQAGLGLSRMYPAPVNEIPELKNEFPGMEFPVAKSVSERILTLPTHPFLSGKDKIKICGLLDECRSVASRGVSGAVQDLSLFHGKT